jgi:predicted ATPase
MEILAELTKYNMRVMLTSHSDFMFSKLGNLVLGDVIDEKDIAVYHLVMTDEGSIDAKDMHITKQEIRETNFADVSEDLYDERLELIEQIRNEKKGVLNGAS